MITVGDFVLSRSALPKDGTYTMMDHLQAMVLYVQGIEAILKVEDETEDVIVEAIPDVVEVKDILESVVINSDDTINII